MNQVRVGAAKHVLNGLVRIEQVLASEKKSQGEAHVVEDAEDFGQKV